ncbi:hypothetical protein CF319_g7193 [Tilletia indica]|nr:hypothetical protein CF319_g7193 [Tilletia indica]
MRLGVGDAAEMRRVPEEMDGTDPDQPTLPPSFIFRSGLGTVPASRTLVSFDCVVADRGSDDILKCHIRRITAIDDANRALLLALNVGSPDGGDRADRIRQDRAANRSIAEAKGKAREGSTPAGGNGSSDSDEKVNDNDGEDSTEADEVESSATATGKTLEDDPTTPPRKIRRTAKAIALMN